MTDGCHGNIQSFFAQTDLLSPQVVYQHIHMHLMTICANMTIIQVKICKVSRYSCQFWLFYQLHDNRCQGKFSYRYWKSCNLTWSIIFKRENSNIFTRNKVMTIYIAEIRTLNLHDFGVFIAMATSQLPKFQIF